MWCDSHMDIVRPEMIQLASYVVALKKAIILDTIDIENAQRNLSEIDSDPDSFLAKQEDPEALGGDVKLPDGSCVPRIPGMTRWMWDGEVCGAINFRWQVGTTELPPTCLGHIGYEVLSWNFQLTSIISSRKESLRKLEAFCTRNLLNLQPTVVIAKVLDSEYISRQCPNIGVRQCGIENLAFSNASPAKVSLKRSPSSGFPPGKLW